MQNIPILDVHVCNMEMPTTWCSIAQIQNGYSFTWYHIVIIILQVLYNMGM